MELARISGVKKSERNNLYIIKKKQGFIPGFRKFLYDLGIGNEDSNIEIYSFGRPFGKDGEPDTTKERNINEMVDEHYLFENKEYVINLVFGNRKIFLIVKTRRDKQREVSEKMRKFCKF